MLPEKRVVTFTQSALKDLKFWKESGNKRVLEKIKALVENVPLYPFTGIGQPEPLKFGLQGCWSRRINKEHRLVYRVIESEIQVISCRFHY